VFKDIDIDKDKRMNFIELLIFMFVGRENIVEFSKRPQVLICFSLFCLNVCSGHVRRLPEVAKAHLRRELPPVLLVVQPRRSQVKQKLAALDAERSKLEEQSKLVMRRTLRVV
jgi:hypothetical protein